MAGERKPIQLASKVVRSRMPVEKLVSGGQTGADRAALDFALAHNIPHGGWCPRGRRAEDGALRERYELRETPDADYPQRTEWNVRDSDGTVIFSLAPEVTGGSKLTAEFAARHGNLVSVKARLEVKAVDRATGRLVAIDRHVSIGVDLSEQLAGKNALQDAAAELAGRILPKLVEQDKGKSAKKK